MNSIPQILHPNVRRIRSTCLTLVLAQLTLTSSQALPLPSALPAAPAIHQSSRLAIPFQPVLAQSSLEGPAQRFAQFVKPILLLAAFVMVVAAGYAIAEDGNVRKAIYYLLGAFILLLAWLIVNELSRIAT